jgi:hypothetical protein
MALAMLAMSAALFTSPVAAAPASPDMAAVVAKRDGSHYPTCRDDCMVKPEDFGRRDRYPEEYYEHDGQHYKRDCLLTLSLSIEYEVRKVCKREDSRQGYEEECLMEMVFEVDIDAVVKQEERRPGQDGREHGENFCRPKNKDDCRIDGGEEGRFCERGGQRYDNDCLFKVSLSLDLRVTCEREGEERGRQHRHYDFDCMLELSLKLDLDLSLGSSDREGDDHLLGELLGEHGLIDEIGEVLEHLI